MAFCIVTMRYCKIRCKIESKLASLAWEWFSNSFSNARILVLERSLSWCLPIHMSPLSLIAFGNKSDVGIPPSSAHMDPSMAKAASPALEMMSSASSLVACSGGQAHCLVRRNVESHSNRCRSCVATCSCTLGGKRLSLVSACRSCRCLVVTPLCCCRRWKQCTLTTMHTIQRKHVRIILWGVQFTVYCYFL